jgi:hypothetical protein
MSSARRNAVIGVCSAAFSTTVQPAANAGAIFQHAINRGKFQGMICATTPTGSGAGLPHHDGGVEHHPDLLAGLTSRADFVLFPVDCASHDAALMVRRLCRQTEKRFIPPRSASARSFLAALRPLGLTASAV